MVSSWIYEIFTVYYPEINTHLIAFVEKVRFAPSKQKNFKKITPLVNCSTVQSLFEDRGNFFYLNLSH